MAGAIEPVNRLIHAIAIDLLQAIVARGDLDLPVLQSIESALLTRLYLCVHRAEYDLQNKLLHVLHTTAATISGAQKKVDRKSTVSQRTRSDSTPKMTEKAESPLGAHSPDLTKILCDGITAQANDAVTHHWVDFLLMTLPQFRNVLTSLLFPLIACISARLRKLLDDLETAYDMSCKGKEVVSGANDGDFAILLNALERLFVSALEDAKIAAATEDEASNAERPSTATEAGGGFLGFMSTALGAGEGSLSQADTMPKVSWLYQVKSPVEFACQTKSLISARLTELVGLLLRAWNVSGHLEELCESDESTSQGYLAAQIKSRTRKAFERIYKSDPTDVLEGIVEGWHAERTASRDVSTYEYLCVAMVLMWMFVLDTGGFDPTNPNIRDIESPIDKCSDYCCYALRSHKWPVSD